MEDTEETDDADPITKDDDTDAGDADADAGDAGTDKGANVENADPGDSM